MVDAIAPRASELTTMDSEANDTLMDGLTYR
jgi:hypothetical protein